MYDIFLNTHSGIRWISLLLAVILVVKSLMGVTSKNSYKKLDKTLATVFVGTMHLQFLLGLILYFFLSPWTTNNFVKLKVAMKIPDVRFWMVEHISIMIAAVALAQVGSIMAKKAKSNPDKFKKQLIFFGLSLVCMLVAIPWDRL
jgi:hypothetical protein